MKNLWCIRILGSPLLQNLKKKLSHVSLAMHRWRNMGKDTNFHMKMSEKFFGKPKGGKWFSTHPDYFLVSQPSNLPTFAPPNAICHRIRVDALSILCDRSGNIRRMSTPAAELVQANFKDLEGTSFFSKFSAGASKGELIQKFLKTADSRAPVEKLSLAIATTPARTLDASFIPIQTREGPGILTTLTPTPLP